LRELLHRQPCSPPPAWRAQSLWLDKGGGQGMVEKRYELAIEHAKCLDDLAAWLKVQEPQPALHLCALCIACSAAHGA
jgi:hypothetical protein